MNNRSNLKVVVRGAYDVQKLRIQMGNRIVGNFKAKLGQVPGESEEDLDSDAKEILGILRESYKKITDGVKSFPRIGFEGDEIISDYTELCLIDQYLTLEGAEAQHFSRMGKILTEYPIWNEFLDGVKGVGPAMGGVIISEIDIHLARHPSSLWQYCGLGVESDGRGTSKRKEHMHDVEYTTKDGKTETRKGIRFNPFLKTKIVGVLGPSFLKVRNGYKTHYYDRKHRLENHPRYGLSTETSKGHRHNMAIRYMCKEFLKDLYVAWRTLEGLPVSSPYSEAKLAIVHGEVA